MPMLWVCGCTKGGKVTNWPSKMASSKHPIGLFDIFFFVFDSIAATQQWTQEYLCYKSPPRFQWLCLTSSDLGQRVRQSQTFECTGQTSWIRWHTCDGHRRRVQPITRFARRHRAMARNRRRAEDENNHGLERENPAMRSNAPQTTPVAYVLILRQYLQRDIEHFQSVRSVINHLQWVRSVNFLLKWVWWVNNYLQWVLQIG